jgi:hypothetical protein
MNKKAMKVLLCSALSLSVTMALSINSFSVEIVKRDVMKANEEVIAQAQLVVEEYVEYVETPSEELFEELYSGEDIIEEAPDQDDFSDTLIIIEEETSTEAETLSYTDEDLEYMIMVLTGECQNRSFEEQLEFGSVVLNRVNHPDYPNTIKEVCLQKGQFACFRDGNAYRTPTEDTINAAVWLLTYGSVSPSNVVYQAHFKQGKGVYKRIGKDIFCYK